ncbi:adenosine deaminase [Sphingomonas sp. H39-1-10]|uniref:adenosine deaminase family protein n=1 Tax=Sphingomonas pollutisoli TaxID=3030829 RepID=UPI0023B8A722|nr:adenosine deaminase [Sphingomonas pollutisoli]MDF0489162.1 adenosine deaminase [Sphingomonas pollutisoli]
MRSAALIIALLLASGAAGARETKSLSSEARTAARLDAIADSPPRLRVFLQTMPKGGDLHNHGGGSIYAEDWLRWAAAGGLCIATDTASIVPPPCDRANRVPAAGLEQNYALYSRMLDALSTRGFETGVNAPTVSGYDRFFATFDAFGTASRGNEAKELALTREQAAADRVSYVELGSGSHQARALIEAVKDTDPTDFAALSAKLAPLLPDAVARARAEYDRFEAESAQIDGCGTPKPKPACAVEMRYLYTAIRTIAPAGTFAQLALGFALAEADPRFVGVNIAAPEHDPIAVRDYDLHMRMIAYLKARHPKVALSLHAGELTLGLVPPRDLAFHIREAVEVAGARRIGHGIDISYEDDAAGLLREMAAKQIDVEINLTSNAVILGVKGKAHPLSLYREAGVPVTLSTDDEGVSRSDMTNEYVRAVIEQGLRYADLKQIVRDSIHHSFLPGASLWRGRAGRAKVAVCAVAGPACEAYLAANPKASKEEQVERALTVFEAGVR